MAIWLCPRCDFLVLKDAQASLCRGCGTPMVRDDPVYDCGDFLIRVVRSPL